MADASHRRMPVSFVQVGIFSTILLGVILGVYLLVNDPQQRAAFTDVMAPVVDCLACACLFLTAKQSAIRSKRLAFAWGTVAAAMLLYAIGDTIWGILALVLKQPPSLSIADYFYLAEYPVFLLGVIVLTKKPASARQDVKNALDLGIILTAAILGFWNFLIGPFVQSNGAVPPLDQVMLLAYPVFDLVLLGALLLMINNQSGGADMTLISLLAVGLMIALVADCVYSYQSLQGTYISGGLLDLGLIAANMLFGLAGVSQWAAFQAAEKARTFQPGKAAADRLTWIRTYLPYFWLLAAFVLLVVRGLTRLPMDPTSITVGVGVILGLVVTRQLITLSENSKLNFQLTSQTTRLESTNRDLNFEIAGRVRSQEKLAFDMLHDNMTGLANRLLFLDRLGQALERCKRHPEQSFAVLFMDLDKFKAVNDTLGHSFGDELLVSLGKRLKETVRSSDTVAHLSGDEFAILLNDVNDESSARQFAEKIQVVVGLPFKLKERMVHISASVGIVTTPIKYDRPEDVLRDADLAMYQAKELGKARSEVFRIEMRDRALSRAVQEVDLRSGIENGEFRIYYQPITSLESDRVVGFEALLRWLHPTQGELLPEDFLSVAEESGLILQIGDWVLDGACRQLKTWQQQHPYLQNLTVSVNLSNKQFSDPRLVDKVREVLSASGLTGSSLRLEITERVLLGNYLAADRVMAALQDLGVQVQIDAFGTGYSALAHLQEFPIRAIKIDKTFINQMGRNRKGLGLVRSLISMGRELAMETIAEGVETLEQLKVLKSLSCGFGQGFLLSKPLDVASAEYVLAGMGA